MNEDDPFFEETESAGIQASTATANVAAAPPVPVSTSDPQGIPVGTEGETDTAGVTDSAPMATPIPKSAMKVKTKIEFDVTAEPYAPGQCTIILALAIRPDDGHPDGRLVVLGARSHDEAPILATARLNTLQLPKPLAQLLTEYEGQLPRRGATKAEAGARKDAEKKAAEERRQASRKGAATAKHATAAKAETKPAVEKPAAKPASTQVSLFGS